MLGSWLRSNSSLTNSLIQPRVASTCSGNAQLSTHKSRPKGQTSFLQGWHGQKLFDTGWPVKKKSSRGSGTVQRTPRRSTDPLRALLGSTFHGGQRGRYPRLQQKPRRRRSGALPVPPPCSPCPPCEIRMSLSFSFRPICEICEICGPSGLGWLTGRGGRAEEDLRTRGHCAQPRFFPAIDRGGRWR